IRVACIGQWAVTFLFADARANPIGLWREPDTPEVVVDIAQVRHAVGANTAGPDLAIGVNLGRCPAGVAADHLSLFGKNSLDQLVVFDSKCRGNLGDAVELPLCDSIDPLIDRPPVPIGRWRDTHVNRVELDTLFGNLSDVLVRAKAERVLEELRSILDI